MVDAAPLDELARFGVDAAWLSRVTDAIRPTAPALADCLPGWLADAPDPMMALANWERLLDAPLASGGLADLQGDEAADLFVLLGSSQSLSTTLHAAGAEWLALLRAARGVAARSADEHADAVLEPGLPMAWEQFAERLRVHRHREYLRIGLADLTARVPVDVTVRELSGLAAGLFGAACRWARQSLVADYGELLVPGDSGRPNGFTVLGMGKLGGGELNFSSDVDVVYLYDSDAGESAGGRRGTLEPRAFFTRMAELVTRALHEVMPAGFAFRVDLRLRPDGINGPIANSVEHALLYYESYGQTWERTALIQARPIAGDLDLGGRFLRDVQPFVYRRYLDYTTVADMKDMKARVETQMGAKAGRGNMKLGRGGIREIEFLVQVLQLIHGGRDDRLRGGGSLPTLQRLVSGGYVLPDEGQALAEAYRFLRNVEHKIQIVHQRQTHSVPTDPRDQETLARRLAYGGTDAVVRMWADIERWNGLVRRAFEQLFYEPAAETRRAVDAETEALLATLDDREVSLARLAQIGFADPEAAYDNILLLRDGPRAAPARARRRKVLYDLAPALLATIRKSADPALALQNLATFLSSVGARTSFLELLRENPATMRMLVELFGGSQYLANAFIRHPELLDTLVRADLVRVHRTVDDLTAELEGLLRGLHDFEDTLDALRRFRNGEFLRIGINDLQGLLEPEEVSRELTALAEACVQQASAVATREAGARYAGLPVPGRLAVVGMGKLGSGELNYNSDLDLIFVFDGADTVAAGGLGAQEFFSRLVQRFLTALQVTTREGLVYRIDTRLRPSGRSGPLVSSLEGFARYHEGSAQIWERQALIKARVVAGDAELAQRIAAIIAGFVYRGPLTAEEVHEIRRLRQRMERELARESAERINIKTGRGGLVDVEFVTQMLQLWYGADEPRVRVRPTQDALRVLADLGVLPEDDYAVLSGGYRFIRRVENALRLAFDRPVEDLDRERMDLSAAARRMGFAAEDAQPADALWHAYKQRRDAVRACYERWFDRAEAGTLPAAH